MGNVMSQPVVAESKPLATASRLQNGCHLRVGPDSPKKFHREGKIYIAIS